MELELDGHVAVATGGAVASAWPVHALAREGCRVAIWDVSPEVKDFGDASLGVVVDISVLAAVEAAVKETEAALGPIAHLVHAAAVGSGKFGFPFSNLKPEDWPRVLNVNVMGMVHVAHGVAPGMIARKAGTMVFVGSIAGQIGSQTDPPYSASKAANINFAQCLAKDLAPHNIRVNVVNPGMVQTPLNRRVWQALSDQQAPEQRRTYEDWAADKIRAVTPLGRWQGVRDIADMVTFLSSARASQVTGQTINVDGGQVMHW
jgi:2-hydroxycyclohexanecarboxyl-CoA dehydrogenase